MAPTGYGTTLEYGTGTTLRDVAATIVSTIAESANGPRTIATPIWTEDADDLSYYTTTTAAYKRISTKWNIPQKYLVNDGVTASAWCTDYNPYYKCYTNATTTCSDWVTWARPAFRSPSERLRDMMRLRSAPAFITRKGSWLAPDRMPLALPVDHREQAARDTLRRVIGDEKFRRFLSHGHVSVRAKSGLVYQIYPGHGITKVYRDGVQIERLCVVLSGDFPPTDSLIMRYLVILNDEADFRKHANIHSVTKPTPQVAQLDQRNLVEVFKDIKLKLVA